MGKQENAGESKPQRVWDQVLHKTMVPTIEQGISLYIEAEERVKAFKHQLEIQNAVKVFIPESLKKKVKSNDRKSFIIRNKPKLYKQELSINQHFIDLENQFLSISHGKVSLSSINSEKKLMENTEEAAKHVFDLDNKFSDTFKSKLEELKAIEARFRRVRRFNLPRLQKSSSFITKLQSFK